MWDVIEHVSDPSDELGRAYRLLKPGGWLAAHTMDIDSLAARLMRGRWPWLMDMHLYYFSQRTLSQMLINNGFDVIWSGAQGRYLRLGYVSSRLGGLNRSLGNLSAAMLNRLDLNGLPVPVNFGDLFTIYAQRPA